MYEIKEVRAYLYNNVLYHSRLKAIQDKLRAHGLNDTCLELILQQKDIVAEYLQELQDTDHVIESMLDEEA